MRDITDHWMCQDCMLWLVNGDAGGVSDEDQQAIEAGERALVAEVGHLSANFDPENEDGDEPGEGVRWFTSTRCACCDSRLGGARYRFASFGPEPKDPT